jgi:hypothetical protein
MCGGRLQETGVRAQREPVFTPSAAAEQPGVLIEEQKDGDIFISALARIKKRKALHRQHAVKCKHANRLPLNSNCASKHNTHNQPLQL